MAGMRTSPDSASSRSGDSCDNPEEKTIYENLMEIFPLMEDFMKSQGSMTRPSFAHQAPLSFTRAPSRQAPPKRRADAQQVWSSDGDEEALGPVQVPLAQDLQREVEELGRRLTETELQSSAAAKDLQSALESKEAQIEDMEQSIRRLQKEVHRRDQANYSAEKELSDSKDEIARMQPIVQRAEATMSHTKNRAAGLEQDLLGVQLQLSALHSRVEADDQTLSDGLRDVLLGTSSPELLRHGAEWYGKSSEKMELARRAYLAAVIVARETNEESPLALCAALRFQLKKFLSQADVLIASDVSTSALT